MGEATQARKPRPTVRLVWCPACGRDDRLTALRENLPHNASLGTPCSGAPVVLTYILKPDA